MAGKLEASAWTGFTSGIARLSPAISPFAPHAHESTLHHTPSVPPPPLPLFLRPLQPTRAGLSCSIAVQRALLEPGCDCRSESERPFCGRLDRRTSDCAGTGTHSTPQLQASSKQRVSPCQPIAHVTALQSRASRRGIRLQGRKQAALRSAGRRRRGRGKSVGCNNKGEIVRCPHASRSLPPPGHVVGCRAAEHAATVLAAISGTRPIRSKHAILESSVFLAVDFRQTKQWKCFSAQYASTRTIRITIE